MRVRELKPVSHERRGFALVAPRAGAWVETTKSPIKRTRRCLSHPVRVRGVETDELKAVFNKDIESHPVRVRGLKHSSTIPYARVAVAPRAGAWVENPTATMYYDLRNNVAPPCGRELKPKYAAISLLANSSHPVRGVG